jgi:prevent-host-death family protein
VNYVNRRKINMAIPQIASVTTLARDFKSVLAKLPQGPVFVAQRSGPAAVVLSIGHYEKMANDLEELKRLRRMIKADQALAEMKAGNFVDMTDELATKAAA